MMIEREEMEYLSDYIAELLSDMKATAVSNVFGVEVKIPMEDFRFWLVLSQWGYRDEKAVRIGFRSSTDAPLKHSLKIKSSEGGNWLVDQRKLRAKMRAALAAAQEAYQDEVDRKQAKIDFKDSLGAFSELGEVSLYSLPGFDLSIEAGHLRFRKEDDGTFTFKGTNLVYLYDTKINPNDGKLLRFVEACNALVESSETE